MVVEVPYLLVKVLLVEGLEVGLVVGLAVAVDLETTVGLAVGSDVGITVTVDFAIAVAVGLLVIIGVEVCSTAFFEVLLIQAVVQIVITAMSKASKAVLILCSFFMQKPP